MISVIMVSIAVIYIQTTGYSETLSVYKKIKYQLVINSLFSKHLI